MEITTRQSVFQTTATILISSVSLGVDKSEIPHCRFSTDTYFSTVFSKMSLCICIQSGVEPPLSRMTIQKDIDEEHQKFKDLIFSAKRKGRKTLDHILVCDNKVFGWNMCFPPPTKSGERQ